METLVTDRRSVVLGPSTLACLSDAATINVTLGSVHGCKEAAVTEEEAR
jgi:hypothetical protein